MHTSKASQDMQFTSFFSQGQDKGNRENPKSQQIPNHISEGAFLASGEDGPAALQNHSVPRAGPTGFTYLPLHTSNLQSSVVSPTKGSQAR